VPALSFITSETTWKRAGQLACSVTLDGANEEAFEGGALLKNNYMLAFVTWRG